MITIKWKVRKGGGAVGKWTRKLGDLGDVGGRGREFEMKNEK
jgi:hypothetical protein